MTDDADAYEHYADPANREPAGPGRRRKPHVPRQIGWACDHTAVTSSESFVLTKPSASCGCDMRPVYATAGPAVVAHVTVTRT